jgi:hypothetical protein
MKTNDNIENDNLKDSAPKLFSINKENPFDVPADYFENLSSKISEISFHSYHKKHKATYIKILIPTAITTMMVFIILFFFTENKTKTNTVKQYAYDENSTLEYLENLINNNELDESVLLSELGNNDSIKSGLQNHQTNINTVSFVTNLGTTTDSLNNNAISKDDIIQYLIENDESDDLLK